MFQSTSSSREERVEFSTKFPVIEAKPETVWLSFYHSMAIFFVLLPHLFFFFLLSSFIRSPSQRAMLKFIVEIRQRQNRGWRFFRFISTNSDLVWNIIMFVLNYFLPRCSPREGAGTVQKKISSPPSLVIPFNPRIAKKFPPPYFISRVSRSRSGSTMEIKFHAKLDRKNCA